MRDRLMILALAILSFSLTSPNSAGACSQSSELPEVRIAVAPTIPHLVVAAHIRTEVTVEVGIDSMGAVKSAHATQGHLLLRKSTEDSALHWRFEPSILEERTVTLIFVFDYHNKSFDEPVYVLPYKLELRARPPLPPDTVSYIPKGFKVGEARCEVHNELLQTEKVRIVYGLVVFKHGYLEAEKRLSPHSDRVVYGGCVIDDDSPRYAEIVYCARCRLAEVELGKKHKWK